MSTPIVPVPDVILASEFPTLADRAAQLYNKKAAEWANSENAMAERTREIAATAHDNAHVANQAASTASQRSMESTSWAMHAQDSADSAMDSRITAQVAAAAAQDAAGLPSLEGHAGRALVVDSDEQGVSWGTGANLFSGPHIDAIGQAASGAEVPITIASASLLSGQTVDRLLVHWWDGTDEEVDVEGGSVTVSHEAVGTVGTRLHYWVEALDSAGNQSGRARAHVDIVASYQLDGELQFSGPDSVQRQSTSNEISFSGVTSVFGDVTYSIVNPGAFTFSKLHGIAEGEVVTFSAPNVISETPSTIEVFATDGLGGESTPASKTITIIVANIVGVALLEEGGNGGTWAHIDANGDVIANPGASYFNSHAVWGGMQDVMIDDQHMVKIPGFYAKSGEVTIVPYSTPRRAWWISDQAVEGFHYYPAFFDEGERIDQVYVGKYQANLQSGKLTSRPGVAPTVSRSITQFITDANARNAGGVSGFMIWSLYQWSAIQWLYLIENATMDSQAKTGQGRVNASSAASVSASDVAQATYRGIVGLWGNVRQWMGGLKVGAGGAINVWDRQGNRAWINTSQQRQAGAGTIYPMTFMAQSGAGYEFIDVFIGDTGPAANVNATAPDYQHFSATEERFPSVGGLWSVGAIAGLWYLSCNISASGTSTSLGSRLAKV